MSFLSCNTLAKSNWLLKNKQLNSKFSKNMKIFSYVLFNVKCLYWSKFFVKKVKIKNFKISKYVNMEFFLKVNSLTAAIFFIKIKVQNIWNFKFENSKIWIDVPFNDKFVKKKNFFLLKNSKAFFYFKI